MAGGNCSKCTQYFGDNDTEVILDKAPEPEDKK